ncbi:Uncharacterized protein MCB1EB_0776 [Mycoavidus cysteinexigens]|uniref:Uncharacterized protein n=1 Tax=Mycoavidus cysteinexigens TaxID=1553431 RepID=A0A2Z6EU22_9BURK|nr:hypothetical protein [Mycoavidus cysteinexigens]BBE08937.1 Uncharacterized protein MCB1EB_0776 [Mycoavidus cysteinexigens]GLR01219.1 hypothetical protein GCM10007934_10310 [Mycoavidus cysteinexigens]
MNDFLAHRIVRKIVFVGFVLLNSKAGAVAPGWESTAIALPSNAAQSMIISWDSRADDRRYEQRRYEQQRYEQQRYEQQRYERRRAERLYDEKRSQTQRDAAQRSNEKRAAERRQNAQCLNQPYWDGQQWYAQTPEALCPGTSYDAGGGY